MTLNLASSHRCDLTWFFRFAPIAKIRERLSACTAGDEDMCCGSGKGGVAASQGYTVSTSVELSNSKVQVSVELCDAAHFEPEQCGEEVED